MPGTDCKVLKKCVRVLRCLKIKPTLAIKNQLKLTCGIGVGGSFQAQVIGWQLSGLIFCSCAVATNPNLKKGSVGSFI